MGEVLCSLLLCNNDSAGRVGRVYSSLAFMAYLRCGAGTLWVAERAGCTRLKIWGLCVGGGERSEVGGRVPGEEPGTQEPQRWAGGSK